MSISPTREKTVAIERMLVDHWPTSRRHAKATDVPSIVGKLRSLTYVIRTDRVTVETVEPHWAT